MSLDRVEDMFSGFKPMLAYLVEDLVFKGKRNEAQGVVLRNDLEFTLRQDVRDQLADVVYDIFHDPKPYDVFGPLSTGDFIKLPEHITVEMISTLEDIKKLD